jgi:raffinose/stachyose/melibiose transport system permease protein
MEANMKGNAFTPKKSVLISYLLPGVALYVFILILPLFSAFRYSLFKWSGGPKMDFIGMENYANLIKDKDFWLAFRNNFILIVMCVIFQVGISFVIALLLSSKVTKLKRLHRIAIFLPVLISPVVVGILWSIIYNKDLGLLNWFLNALNLKALIRPWLDDPSIVMYSISLVIIWQYMGIYLMIFMAGLQGIPDDIYESAAIDGATGVKKAFYITIPLMYDTFKVSFILAISGNMKIFDHIFVLTGGGPGKSSMVMAMYAYNNSFKMFKLGYANAVSIGMLVLSLAIILISRKLIPSSKID